MNQPLVSIIIPVYNSEKYLRQCLDSVIAQTYTNWECILVDDGSKDESGQICDEYAALDKRFRVIHKENGGVSSARNIGIDEAKGKWIYFSDSDDTLELDALATLYSGSLKDVDAVFAGFKRYDLTGKCIEEASRHEEKIISISDAIMTLYRPYIYLYQGYLWNKLFKTPIVRSNNIFFDTDLSYNEDSLFIISYLCKITRPVFFSTKNVYNYVLRESGTMESIKRTPHKRFTSLIAYHRQYTIISDSTYATQCAPIAYEAGWGTYKSIKCEFKNYGVYTKELRQAFKALYISLYGEKAYRINSVIEAIRYVVGKVKSLIKHLLGESIVRTLKRLC